MTVKTPDLRHSRHGASVEEVQEVIRQVGSRSRRLIEQELDKRFQHRSRASKGTDGSLQSERGLNQEGPAERGTGGLGPRERNIAPGRSSNDEGKSR